MDFERKMVSPAFMAGKAFSFVLSSALFVSILYLLLLQNELLKANLLLVAEAFVAVLLINVVFPRVVKTGLGEGMKKGSHLFAEKVSNAITWFGLSITYVLGIGSVFVISRIVGKRFFEIQPKNKTSYWIDRTETRPPEEMF